MIRIAVISEREIILQQEDVYFQKFVSKNGDEFGLRFGTPKDANSISTLFREAYEYKYANPLVYDIEYLKKELSNKNNFWFVGELMENKEIAVIGLLEKKRHIAHSSKGITKKKFEGQGVASKIGAGGLITVTKMPQFKEVVKVDTEVRGIKIRAQKVNQNAGGINNGLIPAYINFGDKRNYKVNDNIPAPPKEEEAAFLYSIIFNKFWRLRNKEVYLLDNEDFVFFHNYIQSQTKKMKDDVLITEKGRKDKGSELYGVSKDYYEGRVNIYGNAKEKSINSLLKTYHKWRIIIWKIPTTQNGVHSMHRAIKKGFNIVGYDLGFNNLNGTLHDSVILAYYPNGGSQVLNVNCLDTNKPLFNKVREIFFSRMN